MLTARRRGRPRAPSSRGSDGGAGGQRKQPKRPSWVFACLSACLWGDTLLPAGSCRSFITSARSPRPCAPIRYHIRRRIAKPKGRFCSWCFVAVCLVLCDSFPQCYALFTLENALALAGRHVRRQDVGWLMQVVITYLSLPITYCLQSPVRPRQLRVHKFHCTEVRVELEALAAFFSSCCCSSAVSWLKLCVNCVSVVTEGYMSGSPRLLGLDSAPRGGKSSSSSGVRGGSPYLPLSVQDHDLEEGAASAWTEVSPQAGSSCYE